MKKFGTALAAMILVFGMTGCSDNGEQAEPAQPTVTVTAEAEPTPEHTPEPAPETDTQEPEISEDDAEQIFLMVVKGEYPQFEGGEANQVLLDFANATCDIFDNGGTVEDVVGLIESVSSSPDEAGMFGYVVGAGMKAFCPENMEKMEEFFSGQGA